MSGQYTKVTERILLGNAVACGGLGAKALGSLHISTPGEEMCLAAMRSRQLVAPKDLQHERLHLSVGGHATLWWDEYSQPLTMAMLDKVSDWYASFSAKQLKDRPVLIHCAAGRHRSPTIAMALLCHHYGWDITDATHHLTKCVASYTPPARILLEGPDLKTLGQWLTLRKQQQTKPPKRHAN
jgi:predicted protein tyrosine phosphatase